MIGPEHHTEAEKLLAKAAEYSTAGESDRADFCLRQADVHAKLALAAAAGVSGYEAMRSPDSTAWRKVAGIN